MFSSACVNRSNCLTRGLSRLMERLLSLHTMPLHGRRCHVRRYIQSKYKHTKQTHTLQQTSLQTSQKHTTKTKAQTQPPAPSEDAGAKSSDLWRQGRCIGWRVTPAIADGRSQVNAARVAWGGMNLLLRAEWGWRNDKVVRRRGRGDKKAAR